MGVSRSRELQAGRMGRCYEIIYTQVPPPVTESISQFEKKPSQGRNHIGLHPRHGGECPRSRNRRSSKWCLEYGSTAWLRKGQYSSQLPDCARVSLSLSLYIYIYIYIYLLQEVLNLLRNKEVIVIFLERKMMILTFFYYSHSLVYNT